MISRPLALVVVAITISSFEWADIAFASSPTGPFDVKQFFETSECFAKVRVLSTGATIPLARMETLSEIRCHLPSRFWVFKTTWYQGGRLQVDLREGESIFVSLRESWLPFTYRLAAPYYKSPAYVGGPKAPSDSNPTGKFLAELEEQAMSATGVAQLIAIKQLGDMRNLRAKTTFIALSTSDDPVIRGLALLGRIKIRDKVTVNEIIEYLRVPRGPSVAQEQHVESGVISFTIPGIQSAIVNSVVFSVPWQRLVITGKRGFVQGELQDFDYVEFSRLALKTKSVSQDKFSRIGIANMLGGMGGRRAIKLLGGLLDDEDINVLIEAGSAIVRIAGYDPIPPGTPGFYNNRATYLKAWRSLVDQEIPRN